MNTDTSLPKPMNFEVVCVFTKVISLANTDTKNFGNLLNRICTGLSGGTANFLFH